MSTKISLDSVFKLSEDVVARDIQGELILIPVVSGIGDMEDEIFTFNDSGKVIWNKLDGIKTLKDIAKEIAKDYSVPAKEIEPDVIGLTSELLKRKMLVKV